MSPCPIKIGIRSLIDIEKKLKRLVRKLNALAQEKKYQILWPIF